MNLLKFYYLQIILSLMIVWVPTKLIAHEQSVAKLSINQLGKSQFINWEVSLKDLSRVIDLDENQDSKIQWREVSSQYALLSTLLNDSIKVVTDSGACYMELINVNLSKLASGNGLTLQAKLNCPSHIKSMSYSFLNGLDRLHLAYVDININEFVGTQLFNADDKLLLFPANNSKSEPKQSENMFISFVYQGILHIWIGLDHLAFLLILLFSARLKKNDKSLNRHKLFVFVTTFTAAHSITLISASMNLIQLPSWLVESIIAGSVGWGAYLVVKGKSLIETPTVFGFGLIHGLGFATVLADLTGSISTNITLLLGFNLGVEIGQIIFLLVVSLCFYLFFKRFGFKRISRIASIPILLVACFWTIERLMDMPLIALK